MRKLSFSIAGLILLAASCIRAEDTAYQQIGPFQGLNNTDNPLVIGSGQAQDLLNVDITPGGKSVKKRRGYAEAFTLTHSSMPGHGTHYFYDSSGNDIALFFNDSYVYASISGASESTLVSTGPAGATYQCVDSQGFAYCVNTSRTGILKTNGTSTSYIAPTSTGTIIAVTPTRLVQAGFSDYPNRIDFSQSNDFTNWTPGGYSYSPVNFTVTSPGSRITHLVYAHERIYWFKQTSFGYILDGPSLADWSLRIISSDIGSNDNTSVYRDGVLYFRGTDANIYAYDGSTLMDLTREIGDTIGETQLRTINSWTQSTSGDFSAGSSSNTEVINGSVVITTNSAIITNNSFNSDYSPGWTTPAAGFLTDGTAYSITPYEGAKCGIYNTGSTASTMTWSINDAVSSDTISSFNYYCDGSTQGWAARYIPIVSTATKRYVRLKFTENYGATNGSFYSDPFIYNASTITVYCNCKTGAQYNYFYDYVIGGVSTIATGTYKSAVRYAPGITSWDAFDASYSNSSPYYLIRSSADAFTVDSSTPTWYPLTDGNIPTVTPSAYFQFASSFSITQGNPNPILDAFTFNWFEGNAADKSYATYHNDAIWWAVTSGTGATTNNKILRYDLINPNTWTIYDIPTNGMYVKNQYLYFIGSSTGVVYKFGHVDNDNGSAINAYWKSKDFIGVSPFQDNEYTNLSLSAAMVANSSMTVTYTINGSSNTSYTMPLTMGANTFTSFNKNLPAGRTGTFFNVKFGNNAADQPFEVFGAQYGYRPKPWRPSTP